MKNNVKIYFDIDEEAKILFEDKEIGKSGYKDVFEKSVEADGLLTIKCGRKKTVIRVKKDETNNIEVMYSTTGQLKSTYKSEQSSNAKKTTSKTTKNEETKVDTSKKLESIEKKEEPTVEQSSVGETVAGIIGFIVIFGIIWFAIRAITGSSSPKNNISGCYYITNHLYEGTDTKLCINGKNVEFTVTGHTITLYGDPVGDNYFIENEYGDILFKCKESREDSSSMSCTSASEAIGVGSNIWKKK